MKKNMEILEKQYKLSPTNTNKLKTEYNETKIQYKLKKRLVSNLEKECKDISKLLKKSSQCF